MTTAWYHRAGSAAILTAATMTLVHAAPPQADPRAEMQAAVEAAKAVAKPGPAEIPLAGQVTVKLPAGYSFVPQPEADGLLKAMGNSADPTRLGLIFPPNGDSFVVPRYIASGYIKDDEARDWKADELLDSLREGTAEDNKGRAARGMHEMEIVGWNQKPTYDKTTHRLVWAIETKNKGTAAEGHGANYNTYVLGREGYLSMNLVSDYDSLAANKPFVQGLLANTRFNQGKTYADFNAGTDRVAEFGIAALVTGIAAKKIGLFAMIAAFGLKFFKLIAVAVVAGAAAVRKFFRRGTPA